VNVAFLVVTTAWLAGADSGAPAAKDLSSPAMPASIDGCGGSCGAGCGACCDTGCDTCGGHKLFGKLHGGLGHSSCGCETSCQPACGCDTCGCAGGVHSLFGGHRHGCGCESSCGSPCGCTDTCDTCGHGGHMLGKLRGLFHHAESCDCGCGCGCDTAAGTVTSGLPAGTTMPKVEPIPAPKEPAKKMPSDKPMKQVQAITPTLEVAPPATLTVESETKSPFELHRRYEQRVGHAPDYSWLTGQLFYVHADGGLWVLRYAPLWKEDPNGGSMVLARDVHMDTYKEGDLVTVHGEILNRHSSVFLGGPLYRAQSIELVDRNVH